MAHNLSMNAEGEVEMFSAGRMPWHQLGTRVEGLLTSAEAIEAAHLNWEVGTEDMLTLKGDRIPARFKRVFRKDDDRTLGIVGSRWRPLQNIDAFTFMDELVQEQAAMYMTAGALGVGQKIWALAKLPDHITLPGGDRIEAYLLLCNSHDGSGSVIAMLTPVRVVCQNTLSMAMQNRQDLAMFKTSHTANMMQRVDDARESLSLINTRFHAWGEEAGELLTVEMDEQLSKAYFVQTLGVDPEKTRGSNIIEEVETIFNEHPTNNSSTMTGTLWSGYNAITYYIDHARPVNARGEVSTRSVESALFGQGSNVKKQAWSNARDILSMGPEKWLEEVA